MAGWLILIVMMIYFAIAVISMYNGNIMTAITYGAYGLSNIGLFYMSKGIT